MDKNKMYGIEETKSLINGGKNLLIAGDESLLKELPKGSWIGGTIPYFMGETGGLISKEKLFVTELPPSVVQISTKFYNEKSIDQVYVEGPRNGFSAIIIPALTNIHLAFAMKTPEFKEFATKPLVGWISGIHLSDIGKVAPKVMDGQSGRLSESDAVVMHVELDPNYVCEIGIVNIFNQDKGDIIEFPETGFSAKEVLVNGSKMNFSEYALAKKLDTRLPLVADYAGAMINVSFQNIDEANREVHFYAPVFSGIQYRLASPIKDYVSQFTSSLPENSSNIVFSCNCILNFLYSELEGKSTADITGPITFGEVAYQLLNQTMVYLSVIKIK